MMAAVVWALGAWCAGGAVAATGEGAGARLVVLPSAWLLAALAVAAIVFVRTLGISGDAARPLWLPAISLLPLLPVPLPAALLVWIGPPGQLLAGGAAVLAVGPAVWPRLAGRARRLGRPAAVVLAAAAYLLAAWSIAPRIPGGDEPHYLVITQSLLHDGDLRIEDNHQRREYASYVEGTLRPDYLRRGKDGAIYSIHAPGVSALVLPAFAIGGYLAVVLLLVALSAGGLVAVWRAARDVGGEGAATAATAAVGLSAPFFFQAMTVYPDGPAAVIVAVAVWLAVVRGAGTRAEALALGLLVGALPWLHTRYAAIAGPLGAIVLARILIPGEAAQQARGTRVARVAAFVLPAAVSAALWFGMFQAIYGTWDPRAPYGHATDMRAARIPHGVAGLLLDQQFGLLPNAPIYLLAFAGFVPLWKERRRVAIEIAVLSLPYVLAVAGFHMWWGGRSSPARFLVPVLLPLALPMAAWLAAAGRGRTGRAAAAVLLTLSLIITAAFVLVDRGVLIYNSRDGHALWLLAASTAVNLTSAAPSLFQSGPSQAWLSAGLWLAAFAAALWALHLSAGRLKRGSWSAAVLAALVLAVTAGATAGWARGGVDGLDPGAGMLDAIGKACPDGTLAVRTAPVRVNDAFGETAGASVADASRRPRRPPVFWSASDVPPGRYRVTLGSGLNTTGTATVALGRPDSVIRTCAFAEHAPGPTLCDIDLPAGAAGLWITGDASLVRTVESIELSLIARGPSECHWRAPRAAARGDHVLFVLDGRAWVEGGGLWTEGGGEVRLIVPGSSGRARLRVRQGDAAGEVRLVASGWQEARRLDPGSTWEAEIPVRPGADAAVVSVTTTAGFRPVDLDPASGDARQLGAWIEPQ